MADADARRAGVARRGAVFLRSLSPAEWALLVAAIAALPAAAGALRLVGLQRLQRLLAPARRATHRSDPEDAVVARRLARVVGAAARYGPWPANCLQRSLVLWWYLAAYRIPAELRIGVRRTLDGSGLDFHAWVEHGGEVLNDRSDIRSSFATFDRPIAPRSAHFS